MSSYEKLLEKMRRHPKNNWRIEDLKTIADRNVVEYRQPGTSHVTFRFPQGEKLTVPAHRPIKPIYIKQFLLLLEETR